jgi:hypothetical protein
MPNKNCASWLIFGEQFLTIGNLARFLGTKTACFLGVKIFVA